MANFLDKRDKSMAPMPDRDDVDKVQKFKWAADSAKPVLKWVRKELLNLDDTYQRDARSLKAVLRIVRDWDWMLFGCLGVAQRADETFWVFDGGHRLRASFYRRDIPELPCAVFQTDDLTHEAKAFVGGAKCRSSISSFDAFRSSVVAGQPETLLTKEILDRLGIAVVRSPRHSNEIKCIHTVERCVSSDAITAEAVLSVCKTIAGEKPIDGEVLSGMFHLVKHFNGRDILAEKSDRLSILSQSELQRAIRQLKAETGKGGELIRAKAILAALNKSKRRKIVW